MDLTAPLVAATLVHCLKIYLRKKQRMVRGNDLAQQRIVGDCTRCLPFLSKFSKFCLGKKTKCFLVGLLKLNLETVNEWCGNELRVACTRSLFLFS